MALAALGVSLGCENSTAPRPSFDLVSLTGDVIVKATTTGSNLPSGYTATLDLVASRSVPANGSATFAGQSQGSHSVQLSGVAKNCTVISENPQVVTLVGSSVTASFTVSCTGTPTTGGTEISGSGQIGQGPAIVGISQVDQFSFDVRSDLTGTALIKHFSEPAPDGGPETLTVNHATDPATMVTSFLTTSSACSDPSRGAEYHAIARFNNGPNGSPGSLLHVRIVACDYDASGGGGPDFFGYFVQENGFQSTGYLTSGDIVKSTY
nr:hypothetical protein Hi04_10k_c554_00022 [uncultured bacterium]